MKAAFVDTDQHVIGKETMCYEAIYSQDSFRERCGNGCR